MLPSPTNLLGIPGFSQWYPGQERIFTELVDWLQGPDRFACAAVPTGFGKSLLGMLMAKYSVGRTAYLTETRALQAQLHQDFSQLGMVQIMGRANYDCLIEPQLKVDEAPCTAGYLCPQKAACTYFSTRDRAVGSELVNTNYAYWLAQHQYSTGLSPDHGPQFSLLVCDEAHEAASALQSHVSLLLTRKDLEFFGSKEIEFGRDQEWRQWQADSMKAMPAIVDEITSAQQELMHDPLDGDLLKVYKRLTGLRNKLKFMASVEDEWVVSSADYGAVKFQPILVQPFTKLLWLTVPKVLLMSAVLTPKSVEELGIEDPTWITAPSPIPPAHAPFTHIQTVQLNHGAGPDVELDWMRRIDDIIRARQDRKGLVFTVSYKRAERLVQFSRFSDQMIAPRSSGETWEAVERFKAAPAGAILVSPSVTTGYDFPGDQCRYIISGKVPWPTMTDPLVQAKKEVDPGWYAWVTMQEIVQGAGRGTRSKNDWCETFIIDDGWEQFWRWYKKYAPEWFRERVQGSVRLIPPPLQV